MKTKKETKEVVQVSQADTVTINKLKTEKKPFEVYEDEDETIAKDPFELGSTQDKRQVGASSYGDNPTVDKELDADDEDGMGMMEGEMDEKFESKSQQKYFFAKCGDGKTPEQKKWCKMADEFASKTKNFKKLPEKVTENKTSQQVLEEALEKMILKHVQPRMTKKELIQTLSESGIIRKTIHKMPTEKMVGDKKLDKPVGKMYTLTKKEAMESTTTAPTRTKPTTKPGVKPGTSDPFKQPKHQPKPKAGKNMVDSNPKSEVVKIPDYLTFDQLKINFKDK